MNKPDTSQKQRDLRKRTLKQMLEQQSLQEQDGSAVTSTTVPVKVKWGKNAYELDVDYMELPVIMKAQLFSLTHVPVDRQKIIFKGKILSDTTWFEQEGADFFGENKSPVSFLLMGSSDNIPVLKPNTSNTTTTNIDMSKSIIIGPGTEYTVDIINSKRRRNAESETVSRLACYAARTSYMPRVLGFGNFGNTCYINSIVHFLKAITPLRDYLISQFEFDEVSTLVNNNIITPMFLTNKMKNVFIASDVYYDPVMLKEQLIRFIKAFDSLHPSLTAAKLSADTLQREQQDANEFMIQLLNILKSSTKMNLDNMKTWDFFSDPKYDNAIDNFTTIEFNEVWTVSNATESEMNLLTSEQMTFTDYTKDVQLSWLPSITSGTSMQLGLSEYLNSSNIEKFCQPLNKNMLYSKKCLISRLPEYLIINLKRFVYKKNKQVCAKVLRQMPVPFFLDMYSLCTDEYKRKMDVFRGKIKKCENFDTSMNDAPEESAAMRQSQYEQDGSHKINLNNTTEENTAFYNNKLGLEEVCQKLNRRYKEPLHEIAERDGEISDATNGSGFYFLKAVVTHKGRTSDSGHYVTWVRFNSRYWVKYDDDNVQVISDGDIKRLYGGGEWHSVYIALYESARYYGQ